MDKQRWLFTPTHLAETEALQPWQSSLPLLIARELFRIFAKATSCFGRRAPNQAWLWYGIGECHASDLPRIRTISDAAAVIDLTLLASEKHSQLQVWRAGYLDVTVLTDLRCPATNAARSTPNSEHCSLLHTSPASTASKTQTSKANDSLGATTSVTQKSKLSLSLYA